MKHEKIYGADLACRHAWSIRGKVPVTIHVSHCTICGAERVMTDLEGVTEAGINKLVRDKNITLEKTEV